MIRTLLVGVDAAMLPTRVQRGFHLDLDASLKGILARVK